MKDQKIASLRRSVTGLRSRGQAGRPRSSRQCRRLHGASDPGQAGTWRNNDEKSDTTAGRVQTLLASGTGRGSQQGAARSPARRGDPDRPWRHVSGRILRLELRLFQSFVRGGAELAHRVVQLRLQHRPGGVPGRHRHVLHHGEGLLPRQRNVSHDPGRRHHDVVDRFTGVPQQ